MLSMQTVHVVRHKVLVEDVSVQQVARELGLSRTTVYKYLEVPAPGRVARQPRPRPVLDTASARIEALLAEWHARTTAKQRVTAARVHRQLLTEGYTISDRSVRQYLRQKKRQAAAVFVPLSYRPGELDLLYAPLLRHVTSCCINRFQAASRIDMPFCGDEKMIAVWAQRQAELLRDCLVSPDVFNSMVDRLRDFAVPYQHALATEAGQRNVFLYLAGLLSHLDRKNAEQIAALVDVERLVMQAFVGTAPWDHRPLITVLVGQVVARLGEAAGIKGDDPSSFPKRGTHSVGVKRQWCSHRGKVDTCQVGVYMGYVSRGDHALLDFRLSLPEDWARDAHRRQACHVPADVPYHTRHEQCLEMLDLWGEQVPHGWVTGDDELGRHTQFRHQLRARGERYVLGVPCTTAIRDLEAPWPGYQGRGRPPKPPWQSVTAWRTALDLDVWTRLTVRDGRKARLKSP
jgi:predicted transcriptional regulator